MILRPKLSPNHFGTLPGADAFMPVAAVPDWLRRAVFSGTQSPTTQGFGPKGSSAKGFGPQEYSPKTLEDVALTAGAALGLLDMVVRRDKKEAGVWRQRLALTAAAITARTTGRVEDEAALRDTFLFSSPDNISSGSPTLGPAGLLLLAWRRLVTRPAQDLLTEKNLAAVLEEFGFFARAGDNDTVSDLAHNLRQLGANAGTVDMLTGAFASAERHGFGRIVGAWLADALLAQRLGWAHAVPLLGIEVALAAGMGSSRPRRSAAGSAATSIETRSERAKSLLAAQGGMYPPAAIAVTVFGMQALDITEQMTIGDGAPAFGAPAPGVIAAGRYLEHTAHPPYRSGADMIGDKLESQVRRQPA